MSSLSLEHTLSVGLCTKVQRKWQRVREITPQAHTHTHEQRSPLQVFQTNVKIVPVLMEHTRFHPPSGPGWIFLLQLLEPHNTQSDWQEKTRQTYELATPKHSCR